MVSNLNLTSILIFVILAVSFLLLVVFFLRQKEKDSKDFQSGSNSNSNSDSDSNFNSADGLGSVKSADIDETTNATADIRPINSNYKPEKADGTIEFSTELESDSNLLVKEEKVVNKTNSDHNTDSIASFKSKKSNSKPVKKIKNLRQQVVHKEITYSGPLYSKITNVQLKDMLGKPVEEVSTQVLEATINNIARANKEGKISPFSVYIGNYSQREIANALGYKSSNNISMYFRFKNLPKSTILNIEYFLHSRTNDKNILVLKD